MIRLPMVCATAAVVATSIILTGPAQAGPSIASHNVEAIKQRAVQLIRRAASTQRFFQQYPHLVRQHPTKPVAKAALRRADARRAYGLRLMAAIRPPHYNEWLCIHKYEGAWNDPHAPYYGGLQMDMSFQRAHGWNLLARKGTADHWTPLEQMWVAENAHRTRGFYPWPNTARYCGLL